MHECNGRSGQDADDGKISDHDVTCLIAMSLGLYARRQRGLRRRRNLLRPELAQDARGLPLLEHGTTLLRVPRGPQRRPSEAILGAKVEVPTLSEGPVLVTIPPGTSSGVKLRLRGKGVVDAQTKRTGDQYVVVKIVVPRDPPAALKDLYHNVAQHESPPRAGLW